MARMRLRTPSERSIAIVPARLPYAATMIPKARMPGTNNVRSSRSGRPGTSSWAEVAPKISSSPIGSANVKNAISGLRQNARCSSRGLAEHTVARVTTPPA